MCAAVRSVDPNRSSSLGVEVVAESGGRTILGAAVVRSVDPSFDEVPPTFFGCEENLGKDKLGLGV